MLTRRSFLESSLLAGASAVVSTRLAFASAPTDSRFVFVLLRGALDGLSAVPPVGDPDYAGLRGQIAIARSGEGAAGAEGRGSAVAKRRTRAGTPCRHAARAEVPQIGARRKMPRSPPIHVPSGPSVTARMSKVTA